MRLGHRHASGSTDCGRPPGVGESQRDCHRVVPRGLALLLQVDDLRAGYGEMEILHGVSMALDDGELVTIIGPNGAGKSTLVKAIFGLIRPTGGRVQFRGKEITGSAPRDLVMMGLGYVPQTNNTFPTLSVLENLEMGAITRRISPIPTPWSGRSSSRTRSRMMKDAEIRKRATEAIAMFPNLQPKLRELAGTLSGGEQQMVALAKSMMLDPEVLLIVEQNAKKALAIADRGYVLETGRNRFTGTGESLLHNSDVGRLYLGGAA